MLFSPKHDDRLVRLTDEIRLAPVLTRDLLSHVVADACTRLASTNRRGEAARINRLIDAGAWCEAALALIEFELPAWKLRRLLYEDGEWFCSLSRQPNLPVEVDDTADGAHEVLPLAILSAFLEACRRSGARHDANSPSVPHIRPISDEAVLCDNFA